MVNLSGNESRILFVSLLALIGFFLVTLLRGSLTPLDSAANSWAASIHTSSLTITSEAIATIFGTTVMLSLTLLIAAILYFRHHQENAVLLLAAMAGITLIVNAAKAVIQSPRPTNGIVPESGYSFPSGHTTSTIVFLGILTYYTWQHWKNPKTKTLTIVLCFATEALVGFSRIYLNVHWLSDILGGYLLGIFWLMLSIFLYEYSESRWPSPNSKTQ